MATPQPISFVATTADFAAGKDTPRNFLERCLARIEEFEPAVGAFVCHDIAVARAAADRSTERWRAGRPLSPIDGMPLGIKDIIETADMPTEQGSPLFVGCRTERDAASVAALREAGAVILGKVVTTEFASTEPRGTRNPWDRQRTPGGSSSGSAAAVACGMVPAALGTQVSWFDPPASQLLRLCRLQAERRRDQSRRQLRLLQPELHRHARRFARRRVAGGGQYRRADRR
jgi:Asp-tRNA(Asn)/Glu-tRNA(Gln) amidotransferase A subunit family amidase